MMCYKKRMINGQKEKRDKYVDWFKCDNCANSSLLCT